MPPNHEPIRPDSTLLLDIWERLVRVETQNDLIIKTQGEAVESRKAIYQKLEDFGLIAATVRRLEPIVAELDRLRERAVGMKMLSKALWAFLGLIAAFAGFIGHWLLWGKSSPH